MRAGIIQTPISPHGRWAGRRIEWPVSLRTKAKFLDLLGELVELDDQPQDRETEARRAALQDDIRALPGYPRRYDPDRDLIIPVVTSVQR